MVKKLVPIELIKDVLSPSNTDLKEWEVYLADDSFYQLMEQEGLVGLVYHRFQQEMDDKTLSRWRRAYLATASYNILLIHHLVELYKVFQKYQIEPILLKGAALFFGIYRDNLGVRPLCDVDMFIQSGHLEQLKSCLKDFQFVQSPHYTTTFTKKLSYGNMVVDIHTELVSIDRVPSRRHLPVQISNLSKCQIVYETQMSQRDTKNKENVIASQGRSNLKNEIPRGVYPEQKTEILPLHCTQGQNDMRRAWNDREGVFSSKEALFWIPKDEDHFTYLSVHITLHHGMERALWLWDLAQISSSKHFNWDKVLEKTKEWHVEKIMYFTLLKLQQIAHSNIPHTILKQLQPQKITWLEQKCWGMGVSHLCIPKLRYVLTFFLFENLKDKLVYLKELLFPASDVLKAFFRSDQNTRRTGIIILYLQMWVKIMVWSSRWIRAMFLKNSHTKRPLKQKPN